MSESEREKETSVELEIDLSNSKEPEATDGGPKGILKQPSVTLGEEITEEEPEDHGKKKKKPKRKTIPVYKIFRFADCWDVIMILLGAVLASASGIALPAHFLLFGGVINEFVTYGIVTANNSLGSSANEIQNCTPESFLNSPAFMEYLNSTTSFFCFDSNMMNTTMMLNNSDPIIMNVLNYACNPAEQLHQNVSTLALYYVAIATAVLIALFFSNVFWNVSAYRQTRRMRLAFYRSILKQEIGWFDVTAAAQLNTRLVDDIESIQSGIGDKLALFIQYMTTFVAGFAIAFSVNWKMALVVSVMLPLLTVVAFCLAKIIATFTVRQQAAYAAAGAVAEEVVSSIRTVVAFGGEDKEAERYGVQLQKARYVGMKKALITSIITGSLFIIIFGTYALGFGFGSTLVLSCELSAGSIVTVLITVIVGSFNLGNALPEIQTIATAIGAATVVFEIIDREPLIDSSNEGGVVPDKFDGNIKLSDVVFSYPARAKVQVLHGLDLEVTKGQTVALVGPSGCGKSTVIQLIQRLYDPVAGQVTIDGHDVKDLNLRWLRRNMGIVSQEPSLFNATIAENIRYGKKDATLEEIVEAAKNANAHNFISDLPDGYNTHVGERGAQLSGGQKQRIAIARAIVKDPKVLLLDEATSALDTESEKVVQDALDKAREGRTTIVIAHRLSTIQTADIIVSIERGRVVEMGSHAELMDKEGLYFELVTAQTIADEESEAPLADFKAAVKRSFSNRQNSTISERPSLSQQFSETDGDVALDLPGLSDHLSRFSVEDISVGAHTPHLDRAAFQDNIDDDDDDSDDEAVEREKVVRFSSEAKDSKGEPRGRKNSLVQLVRRRKKNKEEIPKLSFLELLQLNKPDWPLVLIGVIGSAILGVLFPLLAILFSGVLGVFGLTDRDEIVRQVVYFCIGYIALAIGSALVQFIASFTLSAAGENLTKRLRALSFKAMLKQEIGWFDKKANSTGALTTKLATDASEVKGATGIRLGVVMQQVFGLLAALIVAFTASWELTFILMLCFPVLTAVGFFQIKLVAGKAQANKKGLESAGQIAVESIDSIRTVVPLSVEPEFYQNYKEKLWKPFINNVKSSFGAAVVLSVAQSLIFYMFAAGYVFGAFLVINNRATYEEIFRTFAAVVFTALSVGRASSFAPDASKAKISAGRIMALLRRVPAIDSTSEEGLKPETATGAVALNQVHFSYPERPEVTVLQGLSLDVKPGQTLALVGPSGCGKSTTVSLIERFYDPSVGNVSLDGQDIRDLNIKWLRSKVGIVSQEPVLFDASIAENIRYGALFREVSDQEIVEAAKSANIHSFIETLPNGYDTNVGAKGTQLSGGQKQRIAIARALVRDPKVLLLDEATSALDTESEKVVQDALDKAREGRTSIVIAHRLSTVYNSDVIAVIHKGQVIESGTHSELMALGGAYYHLNTVQIEGIE